MIKIVIKKTALYVSLFLFSMVLFLLASVPADILWKKGVEPQLKGSNLPVKVISVNGTIWNGTALVRYQNFDAVVDWNISPSGLLSFGLPVNIDILSQAGLIEISANLSMGSTYVDLTSADLDLSYLTPLFKRQRVTLNGQFVAKNIQLEINDAQIKSANGLFSWSGGDIAYPAGRQLHERTLPMFKGRIEAKSNGSIYLGVRDTEASFDLIEGVLDMEGNALLTVRRRLLDLSDEHWPQNSKEKDTVFKVKKNIYN